MCTLRRVSDAGVEGIARIEASVVIQQCRFRGVQMTDVMFRRIFSAARVEDLPQRMLYFHCVMALLHDVILVKDRRGRVIGFERLNFLSAKQRKDGETIPVEVQMA